MVVDMEDLLEVLVDTVVLREEVDTAVLQEEEEVDTEALLGAEVDMEAPLEVEEDMEVPQVEEEDMVDLLEEVVPVGTKRNVLEAKK